MHCSYYLHMRRTCIELLELSDVYFLSEKCIPCRRPPFNLHILRNGIITKGCWRKICMLKGNSFRCNILHVQHEARSSSNQHGAPKWHMKMGEFGALLILWSSKSNHIEANNAPWIIHSPKMYKISPTWLLTVSSWTYECVVWCRLLRNQT